MTNARYFPVLAFGLSTLLVYVVSGVVTATTVGDWYQTLARPSFNPPDWVFSPVWTLLYIMIAAAGWMAWRAAAPERRMSVLTAFGVQLFLNFLWSILFFGLKLVGVAMVEIVLLFLSILWAIRVFRPVSAAAAWMLVPYAAWVGFACVLNGAIFHLN
jgi:benzodiazapine receptor